MNGRPYSEEENAVLWRIFEVTGDSQGQLSKRFEIASHLTELSRIFRSFCVENGDRLVTKCANCSKNCAPYAILRAEQLIVPGLRFRRRKFPEAKIQLLCARALYLLSRMLRGSIHQRITDARDLSLSRGYYWLTRRLRDVSENDYLDVGEVVALWSDFENVLLPALWEVEMQGVKTQHYIDS